MTTDRIEDYGIAVNTDIELHREGSILNEKTLFKTREGSVGMSVGGLTIVKPLSAWHAIAVEASARALAEPPIKPHWGSLNVTVMEPAARAEPQTRKISSEEQAAIDRRAMHITSKFVSEPQPQARTPYNLSGVEQAALTRALFRSVKIVDGEGAQTEGAQPVYYASTEEQFTHPDCDDDSGHYIPLRKTPKGKFQRALYEAPQHAPRLKELSEDKIRQLVFEHVNTQALYQTCIAFAHAAIAADRALNNGDAE